MAEAAATGRSVDQLVRSINAELTIMDRRCIDIYIRLGALLTELRPQIPKGKWNRFVQSNFPFSPTSALDYMKCYREAQANRKPGRLSDVRPPRASHHQSRDFSAWKAERDRARAAQHDRMEAPDRAVSGVTDKALALDVWGMGFRIKARELHPDRSGGSERAMAQLNRVNERVRRFLTQW